MTQRVVNYTYGTGNPVLPDGSIDVRDGIDNLQSMDVFMNAPEDTYNQRDGEIVRTVAGMNNEFDAQILNMGFTRIDTFAAGATITNPRQTLLWDIADGGDGQEYGWSGAFPKVVPVASTPESTGGISVGAWVSRFDPELRIQVREALRRSYAEAGYNLVVGSFEVGGTLVNANDVLLQEGAGKAFSGPAGTVAAGTNPASGGFVDQSGSLLRTPALAGIYRDWKANLAERGINLVAGSFEEGASTTKPNDAVMHYATGTPYLLKSGANASIPDGDAPNSDWAPVRLIEPLPIKAGSKVAHRCLTPENTILALGSCRRSGFDAVETDAKQSADGVWYIFHDDAVDSLTNGTGTFSALSSSYINTLRFDSLAGGKYAAEPIPLVTDFLKAALIKGLTVYLEIKSYLSYADIAGLVTTVEGLNAGASIVICSMDIAVLRHIRFTLNSDVPLQYVYEETDYTDAINAALSLQRISFSYFNNYVRQYPAVVGACARAGVSLFTWTILNKKTADQCSSIGATNIVTDIVL